MKVVSGILPGILLLYFNVFAQNGNYDLGARSSGISNTSITVSDAFASFNNIGALASQKNICAYFSSSMLYGIPGLLKLGAGINSEFINGTATINFYRFGDDLYNEHKIGIGYSHKIHFVRLGLQIDYIQYRIENYGSIGLVSFEIGGIVDILPEIVFGAYIFYPTRSNFYPDKSGIIPALLKTGLSYRPVKNLMLNIEYTYYLYLKRYLAFGMEYIIRDKFALRTGITLNTVRSTFGIGFKPGKFELNYSINIHPHLGVSHEFSAAIKIKER